MSSSDESNTFDNARRPFTTTRHLIPCRAVHPVRGHKRYPSAFSSDTLSTLPEYQVLESPSSRLASIGSLVQRPIEHGVWDGTEMPPPPGYPGCIGQPIEEFVEERRAIPLARKPRRRRSYSGNGDGRLDELLERSIVALEASNALLRSSLQTHHSLSNVLADSTFDRSVDAQIDFLARRFQADERREAGLGSVLDGVAGLINHLDEDGNRVPREDGLARSLPAENHMALARSSIPPPRVDDVPLSQGRLRLAMDGQRPRSPPPRPFTQYVSIESANGLAAESTAAEFAIYLSSTSGVRTVPHTTPFSSSPVAFASTVSPHNKRNSEVATPEKQLARTMLSRIASSPSSGPTSPEAIRSLFSHLPKSANKLFHSQDASNNERAHSASDIRPDPWREQQQTGDEAVAGPSGHRYHASTSSLPHTILVPEHGANKVGRATPSAFAITASLRKILAEADKKANSLGSEVTAGKQRAEGERPGLAESRRSRSASASSRLRPAALEAVTVTSASQPIVYRGEKSASDRILDLPLPFAFGTPPRSPISAASTPRRSALKGASGRSTPVSSGQSSPLVVSFSPLPPKHETDGTFKRAKRRVKKEKKGSEKHGWWSEWLLGVPAKDGERSPYIPVHTRSGSMLREEGRWAGGLESWHV